MLFAATKQPGLAPAASASSPAAHACSPAARPWLRPAPGRRRCREGMRCSASSQGEAAGRLLRDALQQPQQGQNLAYLAAGNFLRGLGIEQQSEVNRILDIAMNPNSLYTSRNRKQPTNPHARRLDVEADMRPVVDFLKAQGLGQEEVAKVISAHPALLCYSVPDRLAPFFDYLRGELGLSGPQAAEVVQRRPTILGVEVGQVRRMAEFLQLGGSSREEVVELLATTL